eukprot:6199922-Amphidinium_carterae.1
MPLLWIHALGFRLADVEGRCIEEIRTLFKGCNILQIASKSCQQRYFECLATGPKKLHILDALLNHGSGVSVHLSRANLDKSGMSH